MRGKAVAEVSLTDTRLDSLIAHFRSAFAADATGAYRDWFRAQEELRERGDAAMACALAADLRTLAPGLLFSSAEARARFLHNLGVFFGSPGPAADLRHARECYEAALAHFSQHGDDGWRARVQHNYATALSNLGTSAADLDEAIRLFGEALAWRTAEREIARAVTLHNLGLAWRRLGALDPCSRQSDLERSAACLREAMDIRRRHGLAEGLEASGRELERTLASDPLDTGAAPG